LSDVAYFDHWLGKLIDYLKTSHAFDDTLVVFFADHGQSLGENGYYGHHVYLNDWLTHVPLIVLAPSPVKEERNDLVTLADIAPTVLHFLGLPDKQDTAARSLLLKKGPERVAIAEAFPIRGDDLFELLATPLSSEDDLNRRVDLINQSQQSYEPKVALISETHRLIINRSTGAMSLYDRRTDPGETSDLAALLPDVREGLEEALAAWHFHVSERIYCRMQKSRKP
jgi:choline-sulfatase